MMSASKLIDVTITVDEATYRALWQMALDTMATTIEDSVEYNAAGHLRRALDVQTAHGSRFSTPFPPTQDWSAVDDETRA